MISKVWEIELQKKVSTNPIIVPQLNSVFLLDDSGTGTTAGLQIKRLDLATGQKQAHFAIRSCVCGTSFSPDFSTILATSTRKMYLLDSMSLKELARWDTHVPNYTSSLVQLDREVAMNSRLSKHTSLYNLHSKTVRLMKVGRGVDDAPDEDYNLKMKYATNFEEHR